MTSNSKLPPTALVIFGAGGDLIWRKLLPALYNLSKDREFNATCGSIFSPDRPCQSPISHGKAAESARKPSASRLHHRLYPGQEPLAATFRDTGASAPMTSIRLT